NWNLLIDRFGAAIDIAKKENIKLAIENEHSCLIGTGFELHRFLDALNADCVYALWDPCNEIFAGVTDPPYPIGYEPIADRMLHLHIKDAIRYIELENRSIGEPATKSPIRPFAGSPIQELPEGGEPKCVPIGDGWLDWEGQFKALVANNYNGGASLETHWRPDYRSFSAGSQKMDLTRPGGTAFSSLGEEASQICLDRIFGILNQLNLR
ncbi:MAG: TIM barrel protein, partial [bacterium]|nr:TIM barrel protein [bacterium]